MRIALGADHAGFPLKEQLKQRLQARGFELTDFGTKSPESVDYPDYAVAVGRAVATGAADFGLLVCGTGIGMAIAADKLPGIRATVAWDTDSARMARAHNNANVVTLGARTTPIDRAEAIVATFLETPFDGGRHQRRVDKIARLDEPDVKTDQSEATGC